MMSNKRPLRVLHIIDTLGGGGSERLIWDIVRLSDQTRVKHRVVTIFSDGYPVPFVYAEPLRELGAYGRQRLEPGTERAETEATASAARIQSTSSQPAVNPLRRLPPGVKKPIASLVNALFSRWRRIKRVMATYFPSSFTIPIEYLRFRPDIVHTHGFYSFKYGLLFRKLCGRPTVHMVPSMFSQMDAQGTGWLADRYRRFHPLVDRFEVNPGYRDELLGVGVPAEKFFDITGTLDLAALASMRAERPRHQREVRARLGIPEDAPIALSVGRLDPTKGHSYAVEALPLILKQHPNLHWLLLGEGDDRTNLEAQIKTLGVAEHTHLIGFDPEPLQYYAAADVYLRTTTMEAENTSSQQAIAMGLPTVGFDTCPETDLIAKLGHGILVPNGDAAALAAATCKILSLPDRGQAMGALGVDYCRSTLGMQKHVDDLLSVYTALHQRGLPEQAQVIPGSQRERPAR